MKPVLVFGWIVAIKLLSVLGDFLSVLSGWTDWSLVGWAFAGSTSFVVWESIQQTVPTRKGWHRVGMVALGMLVSLGFNAWITDLTKVPPIPCTILLGMAGYKLYGWAQKKADKPEDSIKKLTHLNDDTP